MNKSKDYDLFLNYSSNNNVTKYDLSSQNILLLPSVIGLPIYIFVLWSIIRNKNKYFADPFYKICISLGVSDILALSLHLSCPLLTTFYPEVDELFVWKAYLLRMFWYNSIYHSFLVAVDRLYALALPHKFRWTLQKCILNWFIVLCWCLAILTNACVITTTCSYVRYPKSNEAFYDFTKKGARLHNLIIDLGFQVVVLFLIFIMYLISGYYVIKFSRRDSQNRISNRNSSLKRKNKRKKIQWYYMVQGICVTLPTVLTIILYHLMFYVNMSKDAFSVINILSAIIGRTSFCINPFVYLTLNSQLRKVIKRNMSSCLSCFTSNVSSQVEISVSLLNSSDKTTVIGRKTAKNYCSTVILSTNERVQPENI